MAKFKVLKDIPSIGAKAGDVAEVNAAFAELLQQNGYIEAVMEKKIPKGKTEEK